MVTIIISVDYVNLAADTICEEVGTLLLQASSGKDPGDTRSVLSFSVSPSHPDVPTSCASHWPDDGKDADPAHCFGLLRLSESVQKRRCSLTFCGKRITTFDVSAIVLVLACIQGFSYLNVNVSNFLF
jgi:hypothetical protein